MFNVTSLGGRTVGTAKYNGSYSSNNRLYNTTTTNLKSDFEFGGVSGDINTTFNGGIGEIIQYNRTLLLSEIILIENYLSSKWGINLSNRTYEYYWNDPYATTNTIINKANPYNFYYTYNNTSSLRFAKVAVIINDLVTLKLNGVIQTNMLNSGNTIYSQPVEVPLISGNNLFEFITYNNSGSAYFATYVTDSSNAYLFSTNNAMSGWNVNNTGFYSDYNGFHWYPNNGESAYGSANLNGSRNGWWGVHYNGAGYQPHTMFENGNGGFYLQGLGRWILYHSVGNNCTGMGTSATAGGYGIYVNGGVYATGNVVAYSDRRKKKDIETIDGALDKVLELRGVYYKRIYSKGDTFTEELLHKRQLGVIAQEVNEVVPEVVSYVKELDEYAVAYGNFAGLFIEAFKEQNEIIKNQAEEIKEMKEILNKLIFNNKG